jgi:outer membrane receptor for ferric coprogen and ferric-rhodotorulic acid
VNTKASFLAGAACVVLALPAAAQTAPVPQEQAASAADGGEDVVVTGTYTLPDRIDTATGLGLTVRETPQSVSILTAQRIVDQNLISVADVIQNGVGVTVNEVDDVRNNFYARGFEIRNTQLDGVPTNWTLAGGAGETNIDVSIFERVEIVRGATGLLSGAGDPSASVNLVRKHADAVDWTGYASASYGSWDTLRLTGDVGGAVTGDGRVRVRGVARYEKGDSYIDVYSNDKFVLYGVVDADVTDSTLLRVGISHQEARPNGSTWGALPTFYSDGSLTAWPRSKTPAAEWTHWDTTNQNIFATVRHAFSDRWSIVANYNRVKNAQRTELLYLSGTVDVATGQIASAFPYKDEGENVQNSFDGQVKGLVRLFGRDHEVVVGALHSDQDRDTGTYAALTFPPGTDFQADGGTTYPYPGFGTTRAVGEETQIKQEGYYAAARLNVSDRLKLIAGGRLASWNITGVQFGVDTDYGNDDEFIPYLGALYDLTANHRLYASYTRIFQPQNSRDRNLELLAPLDGKAYEIGLKSAFFDEALQTSVALFRIEQDNVAQPDIVVTPPDGSLPQQTYRAAQGVTSEGFELEVTGQPLPGWNVNFGYSQFRAVDRDDVQAATDQPRRLLKLFTTYTRDRFTIGGGVNYRSKAYTPSTNPVTAAPFEFKQDGYALVNLMARIAVTEQVGIQVNVENLLDKTYYSQVGFFSQYRYGAPRNATISATYRF